MTATGSASPEEKKERNRIYQEFLQSKLGAGDVHIYILSPDGHAFDGLTTGGANTERVMDLLQRVSKRLRTGPGPPVVRPRRLSAPPPHPGDSLVLHVTTRVLPGTTPIFWNELPVENWVVLSAAESAGILPAGKWKAGASWEIPKIITSKIFTNFYPPTEDTTDVDRNRMDRQFLQATAFSVSNGRMRARLQGELRMKRSTSPNPNKADNNFVNATVIGFLDADIRDRRVQTLRIVTSKASYGAEEFATALRSVTAAELPGELDTQR